MKVHRLFLIAVLSGAVSSTLLAQGQSDDPHGPDNIEARPPLHFRPAMSISPRGYGPSQVRHAYGFDQIQGNGGGQTIAIVDAYGSASLQNDLNSFCSTYSLPKTTVGIYYPQGKPRRSDSNWALETSLDVEWAHAIAPGARIVVVIAKSSMLNDLLNAVDYAVGLGASQISMSWGGSEFANELKYDSHFQKPGVTFTASSGDSGAGVSWPAASPSVVSVGGTTLSLDQFGTITSETAWSGSGGGISAYIPAPAYQADWQASPNRTVPDVSYGADPNTGFSVYISNFNGSSGWITVGGTSAGAPQWAAAFALANSLRSQPVNSGVVSLYSAAATGYSVDYLDILTGSNGAYSAGSLYDLVTGLGSPAASVLVPALAAP